MSHNSCLPVTLDPSEQTPNPREEACTLLFGPQVGVAKVGMLRTLKGLHMGCNCPETNSNPLGEKLGGETSKVKMSGALETSDVYFSRGWGQFLASHK